MLKFVAHLYQKPIPRSTVQKITEEFQNTIQNVSEHFLQKLKTQLPFNLHKNLDDCFEIPMLKTLVENITDFNISENLNILFSQNHF